MKLKIISISLLSLVAFQTEAASNQKRCFVNVNDIKDLGQNHLDMSSLSEFIRDFITMENPSYASFSKGMGFSYDMKFMRNYITPSSGGTNEAGYRTSGTKSRAKPSDSTPAELKGACNARIKTASTYNCGKSVSTIGLESFDHKQNVIISQFIQVDKKEALESITNEMNAILNDSNLVLISVDGDDILKIKLGEEAFETLSFDVARAEASRNSAFYIFDRDKNEIREAIKLNSLVEQALSKCEG